MVFFAQKVMRKLAGNWTFVVVTDRVELDDQIAKEEGERRVTLLSAASAGGDRRTLTERLPIPSDRIESRTAQQGASPRRSRVPAVCERQYPGGPVCGSTMYFCDSSVYHDGCTTAYYQYW